MSRTKLSTSGAVSLSTSFATAAVIGATGDAVPDECELGTIAVALSTVSTATALTCYLSIDAAGDIPIAGPWTETIQTGKTTATKGGISRYLDTPYKLDATSGTTGRLYLWVKADAGTPAIAEVRLWSEQADA